MLDNAILFVGRVLLAAVFIFDATIMLRSLDGVASAIAGAGLPYAGPLAVAVMVCQFVGGFMIVFGLWTRFAAFAFAAYCVATALLFHHNLDSNAEMIQAGKDFAIAGGFLFLAVAGPGALGARRAAGAVARRGSVSSSWRSAPVRSSRAALRRASPRTPSGACRSRSAR